MPGALVQSSLLTGRGLPLALPDTVSPASPPRAGRYNEQYVLNPVPTKHLLADEGSYNVASMSPGQTSLQLGLSAAFSATAAALLLQNTDSPGNPNAKRLYLDFIHMLVGTVPTSATSLFYATVLDSKDRSPNTVALAASPATATAVKAAPVSANMDTNLPIVGQPYFPLSIAAGAPPAIPSAGPAARTIVGNGLLRAQIPVANDDYRIIFGGLDPSGQLVTAAPAGASRVVEPHAPVVVGPGQSFILYLWGPSNATAGLALSGLDMGWWER